MIPLAVLGSVALVTALGCERGAISPAVGFTYNWGDSLLESVAQAEVDRARPPGADSVRLLASRDGGWVAYGNTPLVAEVGRASILAGNPEVLAVVGPGGSREALQVARVYAEASMPNIVPTATSRLLADAGAFTFLLAPNDSVQGAFIASFADSALGVRRLAVFYVPDEYGIGLAAGIAAAAAAEALELLDPIPVRLVQPCLDNAAGAAYYRDVIDELAREGRPDAIVLAARTQEAACLVRELRGRWPAVHILAGDGVYLDTPFFAGAGSAAEGVHLVAFWHPGIPDATSRAFAERFLAATGRRPRHGEAVYIDAAVLAASAIWEGGRTREDVERYLRSLGVTRPAYDGITGAVSFAPGTRRPLWMTRVSGDSSLLLAASP